MRMKHSTRGALPSSLLRAMAYSYRVTQSGTSKRIDQDAFARTLHRICPWLSAALENYFRMTQLQLQAVRRIADSQQLQAR
jgi:hypothetical protein